MKDRPPTIADVARAAGVTKGAASRAVNGKTGVSEETRMRVTQAAQALGWIPLATARALSSLKALAVGLVLERDPSVLASDPFFASFIAGVETRLAVVDYALILKVVDVTVPRREVYSRLAAGRVDGVFLLDLKVDDERPALVSSLRLPAVRVGVRVDDLPDVRAVVLDDAPGVRAAVEHLVALGHARIGHVAGDPAMVHGRSRRMAWSAGLAAHGLSERWLEQGDFTAASGVVATNALLDRSDPPTAIVYANDVMALAGIAVAKSRGLRVPEDLSVVGFDDIELAAHYTPTLTTIRGDAQAWGMASTDALLQAVGHPRGSPPLPDIALPPAELVVRATTTTAPR